MRTTPPRLFAAPAVVSALALAGCAGGPEDTTSPETVTATQTVETGGNPENPTGTVPAPAGSDAPNPTTQPSPNDDAPARELPYGPAGSKVTIAGEPATVCIHGDGWGTNIWAGNANTSCEFVIATHEVVIEGLNATTDNIRHHLREQVTVHSPVTDQDYELTCAPRGEALVTCTGGEGAAVHFY